MRKIISIVLFFGLLFQQSGLVYAAGEINLANYLSQAKSAIVQPDVFQPPRLRYISYDMANNDFKLLLDKGNAKLNDATPELFNYFLIGLALPNDTFWVNLRPDAPENIIDPILEKTDIGKIFLEADLQLKKDTASLTSPQNSEGKQYWDKLYKKAGELFGTENITIPTITRPWIVPNEVIVRETADSAYIYKATLKVMLEQDHLKDSVAYNFSDPRLKELNEYSSQIIRETIIPKLTKEVNSSKRYAKLRQVYYSLVLSRWFKQKYSSPGSIRASERQSPGASANSYIGLIDSGNLTNLTFQESCDKQAYFQAYKKSFKDGEYNLKETVASPYGQSIRSYVSGGLGLGPQINEKMSKLGNLIVNSPVTLALESGLVNPSVVSAASSLEFNKAKKEVLALIKLPKEGPEKKKIEDIIRTISSCETMENLKERISDTLIPLVERERERLLKIGGKLTRIEDRKVLLEGLKLLMLIRTKLAKIVVSDTSVESDMKAMIRQLHDQGKKLKTQGIPPVMETLMVDIFSDLLDNANAGSPLGEPLFANGKEVGRYVRLEDLQKTMTEEAILQLVNNTSFPEGVNSGSMWKKLSLQSLDYLKNTRMVIRINSNATLSLLGMAHLSPIGEIDESMGESQEIIDALRRAWEGEKGGRTFYSGSPLTIEGMVKVVIPGLLERVKKSYDFSIYGASKKIKRLDNIIAEIKYANGMENIRERLLNLVIPTVSVMIKDMEDIEAEEDIDLIHHMDYMQSALIALGKHIDNEGIRNGNLKSLCVKYLQDLIDIYSDPNNTAKAKYFADILDSVGNVNNGSVGLPLMGVRLSQETPDNWRLVRFGNLSEPVKSILLARTLDVFPEAIISDIIADNDAFVVELNDNGEINIVLGTWIKGMMNGIYIRNDLDLSSRNNKIISDTLNDSMAGRKSVDSPVLGKKIPALDEYGRKIELIYFKFNELNDQHQKIVRDMIKNGVSFPLTSTSVRGGRQLLTNNIDHINKMRFALSIEGWSIKIKGILDNKGSEIEVMGDSESIEKALEKAWEEEMSVSPVQDQGIVSSVLKKQFGGIDLTDRVLHIKLERVGSFASTPLLLPQVKDVQGLDLDKEFAQVEALASSGIVPNSHRLLELFTVCHYRGEFGERLNQIISCLKSSSAIQEAQAIDSDEDFRLALMMPEMLS